MPAVTAESQRAFRFVQFEFPWALGPPDGRYVLRPPASDALARTPEPAGDDPPPDTSAGGAATPTDGRVVVDGQPAAPSHVLVLTTLGAPERRLLRRRRRRRVASEPAPTPVTTTRATVIDAVPVAAADADRWMAAVGTAEVRAALAAVARAVRAHRVVSGDAGAHPPGLGDALVVRAGYGAGEQVVDGRWAAARELALVLERRRRRGVDMRPHERLAALLGGRAQALACEELALRARTDLDHGQLREAALQLRAALDAALSELRGARGLTPGRLDRLADERASTASLAQSALDGRPLSDDATATLHRGLAALDAALRDWERAAERG